VSGPEILAIRLYGDPVPVIPAGDHVHLCPSCFVYVGCEYACACPEDLTREDGTRCGSPALCIFCEGRS